MMRIAKIAVDGDGVAGEATTAGELDSCTDSAVSGAAESRRARGAGESLRGRGAAVNGRGAFAMSLLASTWFDESSGSDDGRTLAPASTLGSFSESAGLERRRGIGGG